MVVEGSMNLFFFATRNQCKNRVENKDFGFLFIFDEMAKKFGKNIKKSNVQLAFNPPSNPNFRNLGPSDHYNPWSLENNPNWLNRIRYISIFYQYQLHLINLPRIYDLYPIFCRMNIWKKAFQEMCLRVLVSSSCLYLAREKRTLAFCWEGHKHKKEVFGESEPRFQC